MPGRLTVFGGVTLPISSDDLAIPSMVGIFFRVVSTLAAAILLAVGLAQQTCPVQIIDAVFLSVVLALTFVTSLLYIQLYRVTSSGNMLQHDERDARTVPVYHALAIAYCMEVGLGVLGLYAISTSICHVKSELFIVEIIAVVAIFMDFIILGIVLGILLFATKGKKPKQLSEHSYQKTVAKLLKGMAVMCCGLFGTLESPMGNQEFAWSEISRIVHTFLRDTLVDFTVTDIFAAFVLLRAEQRDLEAKRVEKALSSPGVVSSPKSPNVRFKSQSLVASTPITGADRRAMEAMQEFEDFAPYMLGIYGWKLQFYMSPLTFLCNFPAAMYRRLRYGNNVEHHIFKATIGTSKQRQIVYSSFTSYLGEAVPYTITVDHERKAVVISLRGTMSVGDIATDLLCAPARLDLAARQWGVKDGEKHFTHSGMLAVANRIRTDIEKQQILHRLMRVKGETEEETQARESIQTVNTILTNEDRESFLKAMGKGKDAPLPDGLMYSTEVFIGDRELSKLDCSKYKLICCGHSLGSCMAAILSLLLRPRFPQIKCLAYSCVSAIFSKELAEESQEWITSCTLGKDIFGRLSWHSAKGLRDKLLDVIRRSRASKSKILLSVLSRKGVPIDDLIYPDDEVPDELPRRLIAERIARLNAVEETDLDKTRMFMPGRIIYLEKTHTEVKRGWIRNYTKSSYSPVWVEDRAAMQEVQISSRLILDHMPDYLVKVMRGTLERELLAHINGFKRVLSSGGQTMSSAELSPSAADLQV